MRKNATKRIPTWALIAALALIAVLTSVWTVAAVYWK